jgi:hypothetical protein
MVLPISIIRRNGEERQLAHTLDVTEISARLGGLSVQLQPGEIVEIQRGGIRAKFRVYWMGTSGSDLEGQAGVRGLDPGKTIWSTHLPPDESDISVDALHLRRTTPSSRTSVASASQQLLPARYELSAGATLRAPGSNYPVRVQLKSIHLNGLYVETVTTLPLNTVVSLELLIEGVAMEAAGVVNTSTPRIGMEIGFHKVTPETQRKIVLALQKLKQKAWDEQQVPALPQTIVPVSRPMQPATGSPERAAFARDGVVAPPASGVDAGRALVAICNTLSSDFEAWKSTRTPAEIEELRRVVLELHKRLTPSAAIDISEYLGSGVPNRGGQA